MLDPKGRAFRRVSGSLLMLDGITVKYNHAVLEKVKFRIFQQSNRLRKTTAIPTKKTFLHFQSCLKKY